MKNGKTFLAIIPARGGSKRLPRKNVLDLAGKPLISWTIDAALNSKYIDKVVVTSDCDQILDISKETGTDVLKRPVELASDTSTTFDTIKDVIDRVDKYDFIILLQATSPLRSTKHIDAAIGLLDTKSADAVISVSEMEHSPLWSNTLPKDDDMSLFLRSEIKNKRSQELETYYRLNGAIYICKKERLLLESSFFIKDNIYAYKMDRKHSVDIDDDLDFELTKTLIVKFNLQNNA